MEYQSDQYPIFEVPIKALHQASTQPESRLQATTAMNSLKNSILREGLKYPPLVIRRKEGDGYTICDGHRRVACCNALGWQKVPVLVTDGNPSEVFSAVCGTTKPLSATQWVEVYLLDGEVPSGPTKVSIKKLDETVGREFLKRLVEKGLSPQIWSLANRMMRYTGLDDSRKKDVLEWILRHKITRQVAAYMGGENPPTKLLHAFESDKVPTV